MNKIQNVEYKSAPIGKVLDEINQNWILLPSIQRKFVWSHKQVESLFDSLLSNYPIGTFLFWRLEGRTERKKYNFYSLVKDVSDETVWNIKNRGPLNRNHIDAILDGQQRLTALYAGLYGSYTYKTPGKWASSPDAKPHRKLYLNLFYRPGENDQYNYEFKFKTEKEAELCNENNLWFKVSGILDLKGKREINNFINNYQNSVIIPENIKQKIKRHNHVYKDLVMRLFNEIFLDGNINYARLNTPDLDNILDIFIRVNSGGIVLSKTDLLFSTITSKWEEARDKVEDLIKKCDEFGFKFDNELIMRSCLVLMDFDVLFKVKGFSKVKVFKIKDNWNGISSAIINTTILLNELKIPERRLKSKNSIIPVFYYYYKQSKIDDIVKQDIYKYIIHSNLKNIFGSHGDRVLKVIRKIMNGTSKNEKDRIALDPFDFKTLSLEFDKKMRLDNKSLSIINDDIDAWFDELKKGPQTYLLLSLIFQDHILDMIEVHQDHIHPSARFNIDKNPIAYQKKDRIPNLMFLKAKDNKKKQDIPFREWIETNYKSKKARLNFFKENCIPTNVDLDFNKFTEFYDARETLLKDKLRETFDIKS